MIVRGKTVEAGSEMLCYCPGCAREKLYVSIRKRVGFCVYCKTKYGRKELEGLIAPTEERVISLTQVPVLVGLQHPDAEPARDYLAGRGVYGDRAIFYDREMRRCYFPIESPSPEFQPSYHTRGIDEGTGWICFPRTQKQHYWSDHRREDFVRGAVLVEGIFDAYALESFGDVFSLLGTQLTNTHIAALDRYERILLWLDPDPAGETAAREIRDKLYRAKRTRKVMMVEAVAAEPSETKHEDRRKILEWHGWFATS